MDLRLGKRNVGLVSTGLRFLAQVYVARHRSHQRPLTSQSVKKTSQCPLQKNILRHLRKVSLCLCVVQIYFENIISCVTTVALCRPFVALNCSHKPSRSRCACMSPFPVVGLDYHSQSTRSSQFTISREILKRRTEPSGRQHFCFYPSNQFGFCAPFMKLDVL